MSNRLNLKFLNHNSDIAIGLLQQLISTPSFSKQEVGTADILFAWMQQQQLMPKRIGNNVWAVNEHFNASLPTLLLNSHHDTVRPNAGYLRDPFDPHLEDGRLYGLGSNDAGGCLVALLLCFQHFFSHPGLPCNLLMAATAEEEISGKGGVELALQEMPEPACAIVGEPTLLQMAVAERGLMVIDAVATGKAGHAARHEGVNALYLALDDIQAIRSLTFDRKSEWLDETKATVTVLETENKQHNVVPASCSFTVDVRINDCYTMEEVLQQLQAVTKCSLTPRSMRLRSSVIPQEHPLVQAGKALGLTSYGSPTTSDKALMPFPALKCGPGDSARSHSADEFIYIREIADGIDHYIHLVETYCHILTKGGII